MRPVFPWAQSMLARTCSLGFLVNVCYRKFKLRLRFTVQHVYRHAENLGNECADHAAALGTFGLVSNQNISTRWARPSFDSDSCYLVITLSWKSYVMLEQREYLPPCPKSEVLIFS